jgi:hypothetical protein
MARKAGKAAIAVTSRSSSKRGASTISSRQSKRAKATGKSYVEPNSDEDLENVASPFSADKNEENESDYDAESAEDAESDPESDHAEEDSEDNSKPARGTPRGRSTKKTVLPLHKKHQKEEDLWRSGAKLSPGTQVIIKRPKAREAGSVSYTDDTIHPNTMLFLSDLAANNERQWLKGMVFLCVIQSHDLAPILQSDKMQAVSQ